jgi:uncharacterized protein (UPF0335 family)
MHFAINFHNKINSEISEVYSEYMTSGFIGIIEYCLKTNKKYTTEEISKLVINLYSTDILKLARK